MRSIRPVISILVFVIGTASLGTAIHMRSLAAQTSGAASPSTKPFCGNTIVDTKEECDDGNHKPGDGCNRFCKKEFCSDKIVTSSLNEECDDGNKNSNDGCSSACKFEYCGDGALQTNWEKCDDGNVESDDGCNWQCRVDTVKPKKPAGGGSTGGACLTYGSEVPDELSDGGKNLPVSCDDPKCAFGPCSWKGNTTNIDCLNSEPPDRKLQAIDCGHKDCTIGPCNGPVRVKRYTGRTEYGYSTDCREYTDGSKECREPYRVETRSSTSAPAPPPPPALEVTLSGPSSANKGTAGQSLQYTVTVKNVSGTSANQLIVGIQLPEAPLGVYAPPGITCSKVNDGYSQSYLNCGRLDIEPGQSKTMQIMVTLGQQKCNGVLHALASVGYQNGRIKSNEVNTTVTCL